jgi:hypothetical protein
LLNPQEIGSPNTSGHDGFAFSSTGIDQVNLGTLTATGKDAPANPSVHNGEEDFENPSRPKGVRFAILFTSILAGDLFCWIRTLYDEYPSRLPTIHWPDH